MELVPLAGLSETHSFPHGTQGTTLSSFVVQHPKLLSAPGSLHLL